MTQKRIKMKLGRKLKISSAADLEKEISAYFKNCQHNRIVSNKAGLCNHLGISKKTLYNYWTNEDNPEYNDLIDRAFLTMEDVNVQGLYSKYSSGAQFVLKNQYNWNAEEKITKDVKISFEDYLKEVENDY